MHTKRLSRLFLLGAGRSVYDFAQVGRFPSPLFSVKVRQMGGDAFRHPVAMGFAHSHLLSIEI